MSYAHLIDLNDFLDEVGDILSEPTQSKDLAEFFTDIVSMTSYPGTEYPPEYSVKISLPFQNIILVLEK